MSSKRKFYQAALEAHRHTQEVVQGLWSRPENNRGLQEEQKASLTDEERENCRKLSNTVSAEVKEQIAKSYLFPDQRMYNRLSEMAGEKRRVRLFHNDRVKLPRTTAVVAPVIVSHTDKGVSVEEGYRLRTIEPMRCRMKDNGEVVEALKDNAQLMITRDEETGEIHREYIERTDETVFSLKDIRKIVRRAEERPSVTAARKEQIREIARQRAEAKAKVQAQKSADDVLQDVLSLLGI